MFKCESFPVEEGNGRKHQVVMLSGTASIAEVGRGKEVLLEALGAGDEVLLECGSLENLDFSWLQLLCAAHRNAASRGKRLRFAELTPALLNAIEASGFSRRQGCSASGGSPECLWICGVSAPQQGREHA